MTRIPVSRLLQPIASAEDEAERRAAAVADPGAFHGDIAASELHWWDGDAGAWVTRSPDDGQWAGFDARSGEAQPSERPESWRPWTWAFDDTEAPFYRWFDGAETNAAFNELDRHLLEGRGSKAAFQFEGDRWDPAKNDGRGGPVVEHRISYRELFLASVVRMEVLRGLGLKKGDRVAFNLPNIPEQVFYTEAAKRMGVIYTPVFGGFSAKTLSDRIADAGAKVVVTADGGYRNAEVVPYKEAYADPALDTYLPLGAALEALFGPLERFEDAEMAQRIFARVRSELQKEITLERADLMRSLGRALAKETQLSADRRASLRTEVARALTDAGHRVEAVIVIRHTGQEIVWRDRDRASADLVAEAEARVLEAARAQGLEVHDFEGLSQLEDRALFAALSETHGAVPVDAGFPLFFIYTSGSTGKPKGVVHTHGAWLAGVSHTMRAAFGATEEDRMYVIADPGWITGQSYLIAGPLVRGMTSILAEGSPLFPHAGRFSSIIDRHGATIFKAGSTFLKSVMTDPEHTADMRAFDMSRLKVATFCAEPVSPAVQSFAMREVCPRYINSYWATEHGGIVLTCPWGEAKSLSADAMTHPLPWIQAETRIATARDADGRAREWRTAEVGEKGELVITQPYPYLAQTLWGDADRVGTPEWRGDLARFTEVYFDKWSGGTVYTQGDYARSHEGGGLTLHGRSDDVINVSGHRIGTEEIEGAILRDKALREDSPVGNVVIVGAPHDQKGETPVAFLIPAPGRKITGDDLDRLARLVRTEKGATAVPSDFLVVSQFPETRSGKYMRRTLRGILLDLPLGDLSTLRNPESVEEAQAAVRAWREHGELEDVRQVVERHRYARVESHEVAPGKRVAVVELKNPPVNALGERALDDLGIIAQHLGERADTIAVVITGAGTSFVAGADVKELLDIGEAADRASAITPPNAAQEAFGRLERLGKPVIAAVNGPALGGGNELVLACSYVVAHAEARFGQPEINLRLLPGYGGTQRFPRRLHQARGASGLTAAARMILDGRSVSAKEAVAHGWVDEIVGEAGDCTGVVERAVALVRDFARGDGPLEAAVARQQARLASAQDSLPWSGEGELSSVLTQLEASGRAISARRCLDALRTGLEGGMKEGLRREAELFAEAVCDPASGPEGIRSFLKKRSAPLPLKSEAVPPLASKEARAALEASGSLLPIDAPFYPGITPIPEYQYAMGVVKRPEDGAIAHGDPEVAERLVVVPTPEPGPNEALVYVLASEVNFNDIWAVTGIPVTPFEGRDTDVIHTGSGGVGLVAQLGSEVEREGRVAVGDVVTIYSGQSELLSPAQGLDPMTAGFRIQGYEQVDGTHAQLVCVQGPQMHVKIGDLSFEEAGSYALNLGTITRVLHTQLEIRPGQRIFIEGAATGTGLECLRSAVGNGLSAVGLVSSAERAERVAAEGGGAVNRKDARWAEAFTPVPDDASQVAGWLAAGEGFVRAVHAAAGGPIERAVSHAGERAFSRTFQTLGEGGILSFFGATSGYRFSFVGKPGAAPVQESLLRAGARAGKTVLVLYGAGAEDGVVDPVAIEAIEAATQLRARVAVLTDTRAQKELLGSLGFSELYAGAVSIEEIARKRGADFDAPGPFPSVPSPFSETAAFREAVRAFTDRTLKPVGSAVAPLLRTPGDPKGLPDIVFERAGRDTLSLSSSLVKPHVGRVVYAESVEGQRLSFYAPQVWTRQRRILMPTAEIRGSHLNTAHEMAEAQARIASGLVGVTPPTPVDFEKLPEAHQAMWENRHDGANYVAVHALPRMGLKTKDELYRAWALKEARARGESVAKTDTGSATTLR